MWVFLNDAFLSIVQKDGDEGTLLVRGRVRGDIERVFPEASVLETQTLDYRFRAWLPREIVASAMFYEVTRVDYPNFKGSVLEDDRHSAYMRCWLTMNTLQSSRAEFEVYATLAEGLPAEDFAFNTLSSAKTNKLHKKKRRPAKRQVWSGR